jgi:hypothetical protein
MMIEDTMNTLFAKQYKLRILNGIATLDCTGLRRMCQGIGTWHHHPRGREMPRTCPLAPEFNKINSY